MQRSDEIVVTCRCPRIPHVLSVSQQRGRTSQNAEAFVRAFLLYRRVLCAVQHVHSRAEDNAGSGPAMMRWSKSLHSAEIAVDALHAASDAVSSHMRKLRHRDVLEL